MSLTFAHPAYLWAALGALVPIVIHLLHRRRTRREPFAAIAFILRSQARHARRMRLKRLLLLLLRVLACVVIPVALARPYIAAPTTVPTRDARAVVVVLDTSFSMRYRLDGERLFDRAKKEAGRILDDLGPADAAAVLPCADGTVGTLPGLGYDLARARDVLQNAEVGYRASNMDACLELAVSLLEGSLLDGLEIVVLTDMTASAWSLDAPLPEVRRGSQVLRPRVKVVDVAEGSELPNHWIAGVEAEPAYALGPKGYAFDVELQSSRGSEPEELSLELDVAKEAKVRGFVEIPEGGGVHKALSHAFERGGDHVTIVRLEKDALPEDDEMAVLLKVRQDLRALVVDGEPTTDRFADEVYFVERALAPGRGESSAIFPVVVDADALRPDRIDGMDLVFLLNVGVLSAETGERLVRFVEEGGGLFVSVGGKVDPDLLNERLGAVLPAALHLPRAAENGAVAFGAIAWDHPIFGIFVGEGREGFGSARFHSYYLTRPPAHGAEVLATYEDDTPALLLREVGRGRSALYTSTVDRAWTDFPIRTAFLPTLQQLAGYLAHSLEERKDFLVPLGASHRLVLREGIEAITVITPQGERRELEVPPNLQVDVGPTDVPGLYEVLQRERGARTFERAPALDFVVRLDPLESDTSRLDPAELEARFGSEEAGLGAPTSVVVGSQRSEQTLWSLALALVVLLLVTEGWLLR